VRSQTARDRLPLDRLYHLREARPLAEAIGAEHLNEDISIAHRLVSANTKIPGRFKRTIASASQMFTLTLTALRYNLVAFDFTLTTANDSH
jgi:hypothetical protein